ncbi:bacterioferritin [Gluconacetobacter azotocaptans]|uniref:bacterioferritin n=1 Tax=Gluconacetobacter azotocaptans TaxID=142834 RepID=UPI00195664E4|nr:bacterioferritin [Gluconacetobacter azotocaptans]MBM9403538.1 bacterioferritin [Gluconacetobacter azotocaptans]
MTEAKDMTDPPVPTDATPLHARMRPSLEREAATHVYEGDVLTPIDLLQTTMANEGVYVLRYRMHAITVAGINIKTVDAELAIHANGQQAHMMTAAGRIGQPGVIPAFRAAGAYGEDGNLVGTVRQILMSMQLIIEFFRRPRPDADAGKDPHRRGRTYDRYA